MEILFFISVFTVPLTAFVKYRSTCDVYVLPLNHAEEYVIPDTLVPFDLGTVLRTL